MTNARPSVVMMAGGTGGHVFPALAVAKALENKNINIHWMGTEKGIEARIVPENNIPLHTIHIGGLRGKSLGRLLTGPFSVAKAVLQARRIFKTLKPNVIVGMGGYASGPGGIAARLLGIPLIVHEQNAKAGSTNKILAKIAQRVLCGFPHALPNSDCVGNPVRTEFYAQALPDVRYQAKGPLNHRPFKLLVLGGSLGAQTLNIKVPEALALLDSQKAVSVVHQSGKRTRQQAEEAYAALAEKQKNINVTLPEFIHDVAAEIAMADLVICRAGALTVAELAAVGAPSLLVPFPYAIDDHQTANAQWLVEKGAAYLYPEASLTSAALAEKIQTLADDEEQLIKMAEKALQRSEFTATNRVSDICMEYIND